MPYPYISLDLAHKSHIEYRQSARSREDSVPTIDLTTKFCEAAKPGPEGQQVEYRDTRQPGLSLIVSPRSRAWSIMYTVDGKRRRFSPGRFPAVGLQKARQAAEDARSAARKGIDPQAEKQAYKAASTVAELAELYLKEYARPRKKTVTMDELVIRSDVLPAIGDRKMVDIRRADIAAVIRRVTGRGSRSMANRTLEIVRTMFGFAVGEGLIETNPAKDVPKPHRETPRQRTLNDAEVKAIWTAAEKGSAQSCAALKLLLLTGRREAEVVGMRWRDLDLEAALWRVPAEANKSGRADLVPLSGMVVDILRGLEAGRRAEDETVFRGKRRGDKGGKPTRMMVANGKKLIDAALPDVEPWRIHDFRRVVRTNLSRLKVPGHVAELILGHSVRGIMRVYDVYDYLDERRAALEAWEQHLRVIVGAAAGNVVALPERKAG